MENPLGLTARLVISQEHHAARVPRLASTPGIFREYGVPSAPPYQKKATICVVWQSHGVNQEWLQIGSNSDAASNWMICALPVANDKAKPVPGQQGMTR